MELNQAIIEAIQNVKGKRIVDIDLSKNENAVCSNFIICEGGSNTQVSAIADSVNNFVRTETKTYPLGKDGGNEAEWIILDYGSVMVHIFQRPIREHFNLEGLWADGIINEIPDVD